VERRLRGSPNPVEEVALVAHAARGPLLSAHRRWLAWEDLEDCYGQATCELVAQARRGELRFSSRAHLRNMLELRFVSRVRDNRRALRGRSPVRATLDGAISLGEVEVADVRADVERRAMLRLQLRSLQRAARLLSADQRLVLGCQIGLQMSADEFCHRFGWTHEKYRKVAQRGRARLRVLLAEPVAEGQAGVRGRVREGHPAVAEPAAIDAAPSPRESFFEQACPVLEGASE
jgi:DNA-directed RNA polymerase specialized sigma24 family protein